MRCAGRVSGRGRVTHMSMEEQNVDSDDIWHACIRLGLYRGGGKEPMRLEDCGNGYRVTLDGVVHTFLTREEVRDFQRKVWRDDSAGEKHDG